MKRELKIPHFQRYMDDLALFADSAAQLVEAHEAAAEWLWQKRRLRLKKPGAAPRPTKLPCTYLGYRVSRSGPRPTREVFRRMQRRVSNAVLRGSAERIERSVASYRGIVTFGGLPPTEPAEP